MRVYLSAILCLGLGTTLGLVSGYVSGYRAAEDSTQHIMRKYAEQNEVLTAMNEEYARLLLSCPRN